MSLRFGLLILWDRLGVSKSYVVLAIELVLLIQGYWLAKFSDDCTCADVLEFIGILFVQFVQKAVHDVTGLLL